MVRPRIYSEERVVTAVRLPVSVHEELREQSEQKAVAMNVLIASAVESYLKRSRRQLEKTGEK